MAIDETVSVEKHIIVPIMLLLGAWGVGGLIGFVVSLTNPDRDLIASLYSLGWAAAAGLLWFFYRRRNATRFFATALGACGVLSLSYLTWVIVNHPWGYTTITQGLAQIPTHFPLILFPFLLFYYREPILSQTDSKKDIFPFLGALLSIVTLSNFLIVYVGSNRLILGALAAFIPFVMALGFSLRERHLSLFGSGLWVITVGLPVVVYFDQRPLGPFSVGVQQALLPVSLFVIVFKSRKTRLVEIRPESSGWESTTTVAKTCGKCGMPVPDSSRSGGRCPHCNAYWHYSKTRGPS